MASSNKTTRPVQTKTVKAGKSIQSSQMKTKSKPKETTAKQKHGLGKGLESLLGVADIAAPQTGTARGGQDNTEYKVVDINLVKPNPHQPRKDFNSEKMQELSASLKKEGLLQPLLVRERSQGSYEIIAGERRYHASLANKAKQIAVKIVSANDEQVQVIALVENLQREDLNPLEEARGYQRLLETTNKKQKDLAQLVSKSAAAVSNALRLLELPDRVLALMDAGHLSAGHGRAVLSLEDVASQIRLAEKIKDDKLSVRQAEALSRLYAANLSGATTRLPTPRAYKLAAKKLRAQLNTKVKVRHIRGKNKIEIDFADDAELERLLGLLGV